MVQPNDNNIKKGMKKGAKVATSFAIKKARLATFKIQIIVLGVVSAVLLIAVIVAGIMSIVAGDSSSDQTPQGVIPSGIAQVSPEVLQYREKVLEELIKYDLQEYIDVVLALMMQESGGKGNDPMQASESYCGSVGCITDPDLSIEKGVLHFKNVMEKANYDIKLALQSYNFGMGFIDYVMKRGGKYTFELAVEFSQMWYERLKHTGLYTCLRAEALQYNACYGDIYYVDAVFKYLPSAYASGESVGNSTYEAILNEMMKYNGWSYVWGGASPTTGFDCSGLMQWAYGTQNIYLPRTSYEQYLNTKRISKNQLQPGDLIFFKSAEYNPVTHVGMYVGNGKMYNAASSGVGFAPVFEGYWSNIIVGYGRVSSLNKED